MRMHWLVGLALALLAAGCPPSETGTPDPLKSDVQVDRPEGVVADGSDVATVTVSVRDGTGKPVSGVQVQLSASGSQNSITQPAATNAQGVATGTLASTKAEDKTISATVAGTTLAQEPVVRFTAGAPSNLAFLVQPTTTTTGSLISPAVQVAVQDASGNTVISSSLAVSIALGDSSGATLSGGTTVNASGGVATFSDLSIDRLGSGYTLSASAAGLASATSAPFDIIPTPVRGSRVAHYLTDTGQVDVPEDLSAILIGAYVEDGGFTYYPGSGSDAGTFTIPGVPYERYYLRYDNWLILTSARDLDLGYHVMGRPDVQQPDAGTTLALSLTGMTPWGSDGNGHMDRLDLHSSNANTWHAAIQEHGLAGNPPAPGDTVIDQTIDYTATAAIDGHLPDAAKGDRVTFVHLAWRDAGVGGNPDAGPYTTSYLAAVDSFTTSTLTIPSGGHASVSGSFSPLPQSQSLSIDWKLDEATPDSFGSFRAAVHPTAVPLGTYFRLNALPTGAHGSYGLGPELVLHDSFPLGPQEDQAVTFTYGNPFPSWERLAFAYMSFSNRVPVPKPDGGVAYAIITTHIRNVDLLASFPASPLLPGVSPPKDPLINGLSAHSSVTIDATPLITWQPPARGAPAYYRIRFRELYLSESGSVRSGGYTSYLQTTATSVRVPPGMLVPGKMYIMYFSAVRTPINLETAPFSRRFPHDEAFTLSGLLTVQ